MAFLVKVPRSMVSVISPLFQGEPNGLNRFSIAFCQAYGYFEEVDSVSHRLCFQPLFLDTCIVKQI